MKKIFIVIVILGFVLQTRFQFAFAQEASSPSATPTPPKEEYALPYPGLLPNHPLYFLKTTRDKVISFLIADSYKKAEFNLLQADKRLSAALSLMEKEKGKEQIVVSTISKGLNYFEEAIAQSQAAQKEGRDIKDITKKFFASLEKHKEIVGSLKKKAGDSYQDDFAQLEKRIADLTKKVAQP